MKFLPFTVRVFVDHVEGGGDPMVKVRIIWSQWCLAAFFPKKRTLFPFFTKEMNYRKMLRMILCCVIIEPIKAMKTRKICAPL